MKIFCLPSHQEKDKTHGVDFARIIQPMTNLNGYKDIQTTIFNIDEKTNWLDVAKNYNVIYFNYLNNPWGFAAMGAMARKYGVKMIMDVDDDLWDVHADNAAQSVYKKGSPDLKNFVAICNEVDYITCTSEYLKHVIMNNTNKTADKIKVFPNYIDLSLYTYRSPFKNNNQIILTHFGSTTHFFDLAEHQFFLGMERIRKEYPNVIFRSVGAFIPKYREKWGAKYENVFGHGDIYTWIKDYFPKFMEETDILVVPLIDDIYNRCKSDIKYLEASSARIPGVYQKIRQYEESIADGLNGFLANKDTDWYKKTKKLIDDIKLRKAIGEAAYSDIEKNRQIQNHKEEYYTFFHYLLDK